MGASGCSDRPLGPGPKWRHIGGLDGFMGIDSGEAEFHQPEMVFPLTGASQTY